jgi:Flp pilus assembly pilin Flp
VTNRDHDKTRTVSEFLKTTRKEVITRNDKRFSRGTIDRMVGRQVLNPRGASAGELLHGGEQMSALVQLLGLLRKEDGQTLSEYGMILFFLVIVAIGAVTLLGVNITNIFTQVAAAFN